MKTIIATILFATACASSTSTPANNPRVGLAGQPSSSATNELDVCVAVFTRARTCTDQYIPALVDARARHDKPAGIAAEVRADRDGVIAAGKQEWASDSTDEALRANCQRIVATLSDADRADAPVAQGCMAQTDCAAFTACITPVFEKHL
jgi:hypothetical protein